MTNKNKIKGSTFERDAVIMLNSRIARSKWKRVPGSGAMGTVLNEALLMGDIVGEVQGFANKFRGECKAGYNHSEGKEVKQFTLKKEWLDKIKQEAAIDFNIPIMLGKFSGARTGVKVFVVMDIEDFTKLINDYIELTMSIDGG